MKTKIYKTKLIWETHIVEYKIKLLVIKLN